MATMLDCKKIQPLLSEYVDGALPGDSAWEIKLHLSSCAVCSRVADELSATTKMLSSLPRLDTSAGFEKALARRLAEQALQPRPAGWKDILRGWWETPRVRRPSLATAAGLAALVPVVAILTYNARNAPQTVSPAAISVTSSQQMQPGQMAIVTPAVATLEQFADEHAAYESSEPLSDSAGLLVATSTSFETEPEQGL